MVDDHRFEGFARTAASLTGNAPIQARERAGDARGMWEQVVDEVRDFTVDQPFVALLSAVSLGVVVGLLTSRR